MAGRGRLAAGVLAVPVSPVLLPISPAQPSLTGARCSETVRRALPSPFCILHERCRTGDLNLLASLA